MVRLSVMFICGALLIVSFVSLTAPRGTAADVPVLLVQKNFEFHVGTETATEHSIAAAVGDTIRLRVENNDSVMHTFTAPHFPSEPGQGGGGTFLNVTMTSGRVFFWNHTLTASDAGIWQFYCIPHSTGTYPFRTGMTGKFFISSLRILSPANGARVSTLGFRANVEVQGFVMDAENVGSSNVTGHGHLHFFVDGNYVDFSASPVFDFGSLTPGSHVIRAELFTNNHWPLPIPVFQEITVTAGPPELTVLEPVPGATVSSMGFRVRVAVRNFTLDELGYNGPNVPGQGHWHVNNGPTLLAAVATETAIIGALPAGALTLNVSLHNNDHSVIATPVYRLVPVQVANPSIQASAPTSIESGNDLVVTWTVAGFVLDNAAFGGAPEVGRGHVHVFEVVNGTEEYRGATAGTSWSFSGLGLGTHTFKVELYNNDHSELPAEYSSTVTVAVNASATPPPAAGVSTTGFYGSVIALVLIAVALVAMLVRKGRGGMKTPPAQP